jgi:hypothetical protein
MITFKHSGSFLNTERFFKKARQAAYFLVLHKYGQQGVRALASATPVDSGLTAASWTYDIGRKSITWSNSNVQNGVAIAVILQYGHGTRSGAFIQGRDYINPVIQPIFDQIADGVWKEVTNL